MDHIRFRQNNVVEYWGSHVSFRGKKGIIKLIDSINNEEAFILEFINNSQEKSEIRAYSGEARPSTLKNEHLLKVGFVKELNRDIFHLMNTTAIRPIFITHNNNGNDSYDDKGFSIVEKELQIPFSEQDFLAASVSVASIHMLQNYFQDKLNRTLDASLFL